MTLEDLALVVQQGAHDLAVPGEVPVGDFFEAIDEGFVVEIIDGGGGVCIHQR